MGVYKALLLAGCATTFAMATPAMAQDETDAAAETDEDSRIVVTGSRIQRQDFNSTTPMVTADEALLEQSSTTALEQNLNKLPQFVPAQTPTAGGDIQPTATNTPGAATVSLRGLGISRNLVLLDGRRGTPGNASGAVDISTIPAAAIERVEIISGGASATYGADAVAGVTNFILKKNFQGLELDGQVSITQEGDGFEYQLSGIMGSDFDDGRGNVSFSMSMNTREANYQVDRDWYVDLYTDPQIGGNQFFIEYPGVVFDSANPASAAVLQDLFPGSNPTFIGTGPNDISGLFGYTIYSQPNYNDSPFMWGFFNRFTQGGLVNFEGFGDEPLRYKRTADGGAAANYTDFYLTLPLTRYNAFARGNYEINDWIGVFGQALFSQVETFTRNQGGAIVAGWDVFVPYGTGVYTGSQLPLNVSAGGRIINANGYGNPSSVLLSGMPLSATNPAIYTDPTPGDLSDNPTNPVFTQLYGNNFACANNALGGCSNNQVIGQFFPAQLQEALNSRPNPNAPVQLNYGIPEPRTVLTDVTTYNMTAGFEGAIPGTDWTWEAFVNHGESVTFARQTGTYSLTRARSLLQAPGFGLDYVNNSNTASIRQNVINGIPYGFGANIATCETGFNIFQGWDSISQDCKDALKAELKNRSTLRQTIVEANLQGGLFEVPWAGSDVRFAAGASYREQEYEFINDTITTQNASFLDQSIGIYPSIDFTAQIEVKELYGELLIPVLADTPFFQELNLELGGRMSDYNTTGTSWTYKALADWAINDWVRLRGGYNRAERSPNIAELFLTPQQTFAFNNIGDICSERSTYFISANGEAPGNDDATAADIKAVCSAVMENTGGPGTAASYYLNRPVANQPAPGGGFSFPTIFGNPDLEPEVADTWTVGVVFNSPFTDPLLSRLRLSLDWFNIKLKNAIGVSPAASIQRCLDPFYNPAVAGAADGTTYTPAVPGPFPGAPPAVPGSVTLSPQAVTAALSDACAGSVTAITYDPAPALGLGRVTATYTNEGVADLEGIDAQLDWSGDVGPGTVSLNVVASYYLHYKVKELENNPLVDYTGTFGTSSLGLQLGAFEYRVLTNLGYRWGPWSLGLQWQHLPSVEDSGEAQAPTPNVGNPNSYNVFQLNGSWQATEDIGIRFGIDNLFNKAPPLTNYNPEADNAAGQLPGGSFNANFYDTLGRRFYLAANLRF
jgi:outer membrane receptor protein involved in Fe transport